ncbi:MAG: hypothetical protein HC836_23025 [Richelia sp. RM2_1_2]|nr:hypothetical protein [Richelia sp. RM2_1_2]
MANTSKPTLTVICPDGVERQAQVTSSDYINGFSEVRLSVRVGGRRVAGVLNLQGERNIFIPTNGRNGNPFRYRAVA